MCTVRRSRLWVLALSLALIAPSALGSQVRIPGYALIYNGRTAAEGGPEAVAVLVKELGLEVKFISAISKLPEMLKGAAVFVIGGTEDNLNPLIKEFTPKLLAAFKDWLSSGGRYFGICGGGYLASRGWEDVNGFVNAFGIIPADSVAYLEEADPMIISLRWMGERRTMYYQYGPAFLPDKGASLTTVALYDDGQIAALIAPYGAGRVAVVGPHPEADETWLDDDPPPKKAETWTSSTELAIALFKDLLKP